MDPGPPSRSWRNNGGQATDGMVDLLPVSNGEACSLQLGAAAILKQDTVAVAQINAHKMTTRPPLTYIRAYPSSSPLWDLVIGESDTLFLH